MVYNKKKVQTGYTEGTLYSEGGETLEQVARRSGRCPLRGSVQGQVGWGSDVVVDVPARGRGSRLDDL